MPPRRALLEVTAEVFLFAGQDDVLRLVAQPAHDGRHHQAGKIVRHGAAQLERDPLPPVHVLRHPVPLEEVGELVGDAFRAVAPERLVRERDGQLLAVRIDHHAASFGLGVLLRRLLGPRLPEERLGQVDGAVARGGSRIGGSSVGGIPAPRPSVRRARMRGTGGDESPVAGSRRGRCRKSSRRDGGGAGRRPSHAACHGRCHGGACDRGGDRPDVASG